MKPIDDFFKPIKSKFGDKSFSGHAGRPGMVGGSRPRGGGGGRVGRVGGGGISGAKIEDSGVNWKNEEEVSGEVTISHSSDTKPTKQQLESFVKKNTSKLTPLRSSSDIEELTISNIRTEKGGTIFKINILPTVLATEDLFSAE